MSTYSKRGGVSESNSKFRSERMSSSGSLPRSPSHLDPPAVPERKFTSSSYQMRGESRSTSGRATPSVTENDVDDHKRTLQELNNRLVNYVDKVRKLQNAADVIDSIPRHASSDESVLVVKNKYEAEIGDWRAKFEDAQTVIAQMKIEISNIKQDNSQLNLKVNDKLGLLRERDSNIASLEAEISEVLSKLNLLQNEKGKLIENESVYKSDITDLKNELEVARRNLDREKIRGSELESKLGSLEQDLKFKTQVLETELQEERKRNKFDFAAIDRELKSEYEKRLRTELAKLRKMYEEQTEKAKNEFMYLHSNKLAELQDLLSAERTSSSGAKGEIKEWKSRIEQYKITIGELEAGRLDLDQQIRELRTEMEEQGATFRSQMSSKDNEVKMLHREINSLRGEYEKLVEIKQALAMEITIYRNIIEGEEKRIRKVSRKFSRVTSGDQENDSSSSESDGGSSVKSYREVDSVDGRKISSHTQKTSYTTRRANY